MRTGIEQNLVTSTFIGGCFLDCPQVKCSSRRVSSGRMRQYDAWRQVDSETVLVINMKDIRKAGCFQWMRSRYVRAVGRCAAGIGPVPRICSQSSQPPIWLLLWLTGHCIAVAGGWSMIKFSTNAFWGLNQGQMRWTRNQGVNWTI